MGATAGQLPIFHTEEQMIHDRRYQWKAWVTLIPLAYRPDTECRFAGYRRQEKDAIQDAARLAVLHLHRHYDEEFKDSEFQLIPQEGNHKFSTLVPLPNDDEHPQLHEAATHIITQEALYIRTLSEYQRMHRKYYLAKQVGHNIQRELLRRNTPDLGSGSVCGESPNPPANPMADYTPRSPDYTPASPDYTLESPPGARPHPTGIARNYRRLFRGSVKGKEKVEEEGPSH